MSMEAFIEAKDSTKFGTRLDRMSNWAVSGCGCCAGIQWGGDEPRECLDCGGGGMVFVHIPTGTVAQYPGGPFNGDRRPNLKIKEPTT